MPDFDVVSLDEQTPQMIVPQSGDRYNFPVPVKLSDLLILTEQSADPADPPEGFASLWLSDGSETGDAGDILAKITTAEGTAIRTLADFSDPRLRTWSLIESIAASGANVTFSNLPRSFGELLIVAEGVSHNNGTSTSLEFRFSDDGGAKFTAAGAVISNAIAASSAWYGQAHIWDFQQETGNVISGINSSGASAPALGLATARMAIWRASGGMDAIRLSANAGNFDSGTFHLLGK